MANITTSPENPAHINTETLRHTLHTRVLGQVVHYWSEVDSTNAVMLRMIKEGATEGTVVVADAQTAGRGRLGKSWFSPPGVNVHLSVLLRPPIQIEEARLLTLIGSLAIADALEAEGVTTQLKWPNDVLVGDKKIAGVLTEVQATEGRVEHLILGIGVNLNLDRPGIDRIFGDAAADATSLCEALGHPVDRTAFTVQLLERLEKRYFDFLSIGKRPLLDEWSQRSFLGRRVRVRVDGISIEGIAMDLDDQGYLLVTLDDGASFHVREGEVFPVKANEQHRQEQHALSPS